jgi:CspA family cold shock protein
VSNEAKQTGTVLRWAGSYGFIRRDDTGQEIFCHHTAIKMDGYRELTAGQRVEFEVGANDRGPAALNVRSLD